MREWMPRLVGLGGAILLMGAMVASAEDEQRVVLKVEGMF